MYVISVQNMQEQREKLQKLFRDTVSMMCRNCVPYQRGLHVQGVIGITVDEGEGGAFVIHLDDRMGLTQETTPLQTEYSQNIKSEVSFAEGHDTSTLDPVMHGFHSEPIWEAVEIKPGYMMKDEFGASYEESYGDPAYPLMGMMNDFNNFEQPRPVAPQRGKPRMMVCTM